MPLGCSSGWVDPVLTLSPHRGDRYLDLVPGNQATGLVYIATFRKGPTLDPDQRYTRKEPVLRAQSHVTLPSSLRSQLITEPQP